MVQKSAPPLVERGKTFPSGSSVVGTDASPACLPTAMQEERRPRVLGSGLRRLWDIHGRGCLVLSEFVPRALHRLKGWPTFISPGYRLHKVSIQLVQLTISQIPDTSTRHLGGEKKKKKNRPGVTFGKC